MTAVAAATAAGVGAVTRAAYALVLVLGGAISANQNPPTQQNPPQQQTPQLPIFRAGVDVVRVDVYPRRNDKVVEGLTKEDFQLTEDGVRQTIDTFEYIPIDMDRGVEPLDPRSLSEAQRMAADPRNRVFVFYLDTYEVTREGAYRAREPLLAFLQGSLGPHDLFAWMTPKQSPSYLEFTRMTQSLATVMSVTKSWGQKDSPVDDPEEMKLQGCEPGPPDGGPNSLVRMKRNQEFLSDLKGLIITLGALRQERKNLVILGERWQNILGDPFSRRSPEPSPAGAWHRSPAGVRADQGGPGSFVPKNPMADAMRFCDQVRQYLARTIIFDRAQTLIDLARRNNVALYFVPLAPASLTNFSVARTFAEETDGRVIVSNDIGRNLDQVLDHQTGFYMLGYRSGAGEAGKKPREIRVRTTKSGVDLDVRRVYDPVPPEFVATRNLPPPPVVRTDVEKAIDLLPPVRDDAEVVVQALRRVGSVDVSVEIVPRVASTNPWNSGGKATVTLRDAAGGAIETAEESFAAGSRSVRVSLPALDVSGAVRASARIAHADGATLSDSVAIQSAATAESAVATPLLWRAGSLPRLPFQPAALLSFGRTERVRVEWPLAGAVTEPTVRLLNVSGTPLQTDATITQLPGPPAVLRADLRLLSMAPGEYVIELAGTVDGKPVRELTAIRITR